MQDVWAHGYHCKCPNCKVGDDSEDYIVFDNGGDDFSQLIVPQQIGQSTELVDQHGNIYHLELVGWERR